VVARARPPSWAPKWSPADVDAEASMRRAFAGAYGAYCVTFFCDHFSPEREQKEAGIMAAAARAAGLKHSGVVHPLGHAQVGPARRRAHADARRQVQGADFDDKGEADHVFTDLGVPTTFLLTSFYWDNLIHFGMAQCGA
jgi:uncharacterized protein YbjT (DUF2867 family)